MNRSRSDTVPMGRFSLSGDCIRDERAMELVGVFKHMVVLAAEYRADTDTYDYLALSPLFNPHSIGEYAPWYNLIVTRLDRRELEVVKAELLTPQPSPPGKPPTSAKPRRIIEQA